MWCGRETGVTNITQPLCNHSVSNWESRGPLILPSTSQQNNLAKVQH
jgi:hypothetical protein